MSKPSRTTGIVKRHGRGCATTKDKGAGCTCRPAYRATVSTRNGRVRKSFAGEGAFAAAKAWRADATAQAAKGKLIGPSRQTFRSAAERWLEGAKASPPTVLTRGGKPYKPSSLRSIERDLRQYHLDDLGAHRLSDIGRGDLQGVVDRLVGRGLSASRVRNIVNAARAVFRWSVERDELSVNPCSNLRLPATDDAVDRAIEPITMLAWLNALPEGDRAMWATAFFAGLRRSEIRGLKWSDLTTLDGPGPLAGWIHVNRSWDDVAGEIEPKSRRGIRRVPIVRPYLSEALEAHRQLTGRGDGDYIFGVTASKPFKDYETRTAKTLKAANIARAEEGLELLPAFGLHVGRHTYGAMLRAANVRENDISDYLGHSRPGGVTVRYTSVIQRDVLDADNAAAFAAYLKRVDSGQRIDELEGSPVEDEFARMLAERLATDPQAFDQLLDHVRAQRAAL